MIPRLPENETDVLDLIGLTEVIMGDLQTMQTGLRCLPPTSPTLYRASLEVARAVYLAKVLMAECYHLLLSSATNE